MIRYSSHARKRMAERSISEGDVEAALTSPLELISTRYGRNAACGRLAGRKFIIVICEPDREDFIVVTAVKVTKERAKRYGFTRV